MKSYFKLFIAVFFILAAVRIVKAENYTVSGTVRYSDNNEIVKSGTVKAYDVVTCELVGQAEIQPNGDYLLGIARVANQTDLIGFPNIDPDIDWIPTGYPDKTQASQYVQIDVNRNLTGIDIYVQRSEPGSTSAFTGNISGLVLDNNNKPVPDAIVYANNNNKNYGFGITDKTGHYIIKNVPLGDYTISANKIALGTSELKVTLSGNNISDINITFNKIISQVNNITPGNFKLMQNYPNPFNPSTTIKYSVPAGGMVYLQVFNSAGQLVADLVNGQQDAGSYEISLDASALSSGVYFYKLTVGSNTETKKMTLIK